MCESVLRKTFACLYVYWWVCERKTEGVCSSVCANEPLIFHFCPSVYICLMNQISLLNVSMPEYSYCVCVFISLFFCIQTCVCVCMHVWVCICSVHVSVHLSREERSQEVWWATQVGFSEVIIFAWLTIVCHALAPIAASNTDIKLPTHTYRHTHLHIPCTHTHPLTLSPSLLSGLKEQTAEHTHLLSTTAWLQHKVKGERMR